MKPIADGVTVAYRKWIAYIYANESFPGLMSPGKDETRFCGYIRSEFIH